MYVYYLIIVCVDSVLYELIVYSSSQYIHWFYVLIYFHFPFIYGTFTESQFFPYSKFYALFQASTWNEDSWGISHVFTMEWHTVRCQTASWLDSAILPRFMCTILTMWKKQVQSEHRTSGLMSMTICRPYSAASLEVCYMWLSEQLALSALWKHTRCLTHNPLTLTQW